MVQAPRHRVRKPIERDNFENLVQWKILIGPRKDFFSNPDKMSVVRHKVNLRGIVLPGEQCQGAST